MNTIGVAKFKEKCLSLLDELDPEGLVITKHGKPVALVKPYRNTDADLIGCMQDKLEICGDVFTTGVEWNATEKDFKLDSQS